MPRATVRTETTRFDLKTLPPDGFVELKPMSYGDKLVRQDMMMQMRMEGQKGGQNVGMEVTMLNEKVALFDFNKCIVAHNLEDADGNLLNLSSPAAVRTLDPRVGDEVGSLIDKMNNFEDDLGKSEKESATN